MANEVHRENIEWSDVWVTGCTGTDQPRALLIGDSITRSYYQTVADKLRGRYACARLTTSKCVGDPLLLKELDLVLSEYKFKVIHFNNGMHGWDYTEEQYASGLASVLDILAPHAADGRLIWAHTTPVRSRDNLAELDTAKTGRVRERNTIAAGLATERGLETNDLFAAVIDHPEYFGDAVHFTPEGQSVLGTCVADAICETPS
jgi:hypothetical protein